jgi:hypothetical protein
MTQQFLSFSNSRLGKALPCAWDFTFGANDLREVTVGQMEKEFLLSYCFVLLSQNV